MGITNNKESQHCGTKPKRIAFGIAPLGIVSIGIVPMGVISIAAADAEKAKATAAAAASASQEAEKAAANYGCIGAHKMGEKWMPCEKH